MKIIFILILGLTFCICEDTGKVECPVIGIDLGTTYSCVGIYKNGHVEIIPNELGNRITPSVVAFVENDRLVGEAAKNQGSINPTQTIYAIKRLIGRRYKDSTVQRDKKFFPFEVVDEKGKPYIKVQWKGKAQTYSPEEISSLILTKMKQIAQTSLGQNSVNAVVTVPAYFNDAQRQATKDAGTIAGLNIVRLLNEPTAAAIAYGLDKKAGEQHVLVFDLGGGTFDVSILTIDNGVFEVVATNGDTHLGGEDFDQKVLDYYTKTIKSKHEIDISKDKRALQKLKREIEKAKRALSSTHEFTLEIENLSQGLDFSETLTRAKFEELNQELFKKTLIPVQQALEDSGFQKSDIDDIVLVGGSTRIPKVRHLVQDFFKGKEPNTSINPDEAVAYGAAVQGGIICGEQSHDTQGLVIVDATPLSLGIETVGGIMAKIIPKGSVIPTKRSKIFTTTEKNQNTVRISVFEGERPQIKDNHFLGKFDLKGIPPAAKGEPKIEVTFEVDANGILQVQAKDKTTGRKESIVITNDKGRLTKEEIQRLLKEAEKYEKEDMQVQQRIDAKHSLENFINSAKNTIEKQNKNYDQDDIKTIKREIKKMDKWLDQNQNASKEEFEEKQQELEDICSPIFSNSQENEDDDDDEHDDL